MNLPEFELETFLRKWESHVRYTLGSSDVQPCTVAEVLALADAGSRALWDELSMRYTDTRGHEQLRAEIAAMYDGLSPDDIIVTAGPTEAIFLCAHAALAPGDHAALIWPAYQSLYAVATDVATSVTLLRLRPESNWVFDLDELRAATRPSTRLITINFPHNPTGAMIDRKTLDAVIACARDAGAWLLSDEIFRFLEYRDTDRLPPVACEYEKGISIAGMSKVFGMGGAKIGWIASRDRALMSRILKLKDYLSACSSAPSEVLALIALRARDEFIARGRSIILANLARVDRFFAEHDESYAWIPLRAGPVAFPRLRTGRDISEFAEALVRDEGVLIVPGTAFEFPGSHFRLGLGRTTLPEALPALSRVARGGQPRAGLAVSPR